MFIQLSCSFTLRELELLLVRYSMTINLIMIFSVLKELILLNFQQSFLKLHFRRRSSQAMEPQILQGEMAFACATRLFVHHRWTGEKLLIFIN
jgi:hypothetical protein